MKFRYLSFVFFLFIIFSRLNAQLLTFEVTQIPADGCANLMNSGIYAFETFSWDGTSGSSATAENMTSVSGTANLSFETTSDYSLTFYKYINVVDPNGDPVTAGERGDYRHYTGGTIAIKESGVTKLTLINCRSTATVDWPVVLSGPGDAVAGSGWGTIDVGNSDAGWVTEFDANGTGQVFMDYTSFSNVVQASCGSTARYNFTVNLYASTYTQLSKTSTLPPSPLLKSSPGGNRIQTTDILMPEIDLSFAFSSYTEGGQNSDELDVYGNQLFTNPGGTAPGGINNIGSIYYWEIGTTLASFSCGMTFDLSDYTGISNMSDIRMLIRETGNSDWSIYGDQTIMGNTIICNNVSSFSQWVPGSVGTDLLPVELSSFTIGTNSGFVELTWQTVTEQNNFGFDVLRLKNTGRLEEYWEKIGFVNGSGNSYLPNTYSFTDTKHLNGIVKYKLKQIDTDGNYSYSKVIEINLDVPLKFELEQNYPNPFNPSTLIRYNVSSKSSIKLVIYDVLGREIETLVDEIKEAGNYEINFVGSNMASGTYFLKLQSDNFIQTKKMMLFK